MPSDRERLIVANLGLVHSCARRFLGRGVEYDDLFQAGCVGLVKAFDGFNSELGYRFSTYAVPVILGEIKRIFREGGTVKVSRRLKDLSMKIAVAVEQHQKETGAEPTVSEIAARLSVGEEEIAEALNASKTTLSLTPDEDGACIEARVESCEERLTELLALGSALSLLEQYEQKIIALRFQKDKTQAETARLLGITQVAVSRAERRILAKLRKTLED